MTPAHLCLTCKLADWQQTKIGRIHPGGRGRCKWKPPYIPTAAVFRWSWHDSGRQPIPSVGGYIERRPGRPITECETYEVTK
jgi:hypothetical protein